MLMLAAAAAAQHLLAQGDKFAKRDNRRAIRGKSVSFLWPDYCHIHYRAFFIHTSAFIQAQAYDIHCQIVALFRAHFSTMG